MPLITAPDYQPTGIYKNAHIQTIFPNRFRKIEKPYLKRFRFELSDGDFIDVDAHQTGNSKLLVLVHGLEGSTQSKYMLGATQHFTQLGFDVLALHQRSCSGVLNRLPQLYHHGITTDIQEVLNQFAPQYNTLFLMGFSLGGNQVLKFLGQATSKIPENLKAAAAISAPIFLPTCVIKIHQPQQWVYHKMFLDELKAKILKKAQQFPEHINASKLPQTKSLYDFDNNFTAPLFGFDDGQDYYQKASSLPFLKSIQTPTLLLNALDDPMLSVECFPTALAEQHAFLHLCTPQNGGHVGFFNNSKKWYLSEALAERFFKQFC